MQAENKMPEMVPSVWVSSFLQALFLFEVYFDDKYHFQVLKVKFMPYISVKRTISRIPGKYENFFPGIGKYFFPGIPGKSGNGNSREQALVRMHLKLSLFNSQEVSDT